MSELSCDTPFIGQIGALDLVRNLSYPAAPRVQVQVQVQAVSVTLYSLLLTALCL